MKRMSLILGLLLLFSGCGSRETFETISDEILLPAMAEPAEIWVELPEDSAMPVMESEEGIIYICEDYDVSVQTMARGDLDGTCRKVSGFGVSDLTIIQTAEGEVDCYEFVWTAAGETGQKVGRATVLDDGNYHYVLSALIDADKLAEYQEIWNGIFQSFRLI